ncbi:MAG: DUF4349 domain-containing protein [Actinomycetota bacterium]
MALTTFGLTACGTAGDDDSASAEPAEDAAVDGGDDGFGEFDVRDDTADAEEAPADEARTGGLAAAELAPADFGRDIITEVGLVMATDDVARTVDDVRRLTASNGGAVFASDVSIEPQLDDGTVPGGGRIVVRIPPQDLDRLLGALDGLGGVVRVTQDSEDVTDQLVDLEIRIRQARAGIARIEGILENTTELDDLFAVETELSRRQVELERLLASQRSTEDRVALATLTVDIAYRVDTTPAAPTDDDGIGDAFESGWSAFLGALFAIGFVLAVLAPFLATAAVVGLFVLLVARHLRRRDHDAALGTRPTNESPVETPASDGSGTDAPVSEPADEPSPTA